LGVLPRKGIEKHGPPCENDAWSIFMTIAITCTCGNTFAADPAWADRLVACPVCNDLLAVSGGEGRPGALVGAARDVADARVLPEGEIQLRIEPRDEVVEAAVDCVEEQEDDGPDTYALMRAQGGQLRGSAPALQKFWAAIGVIRLQHFASCLAYGPANEWGLAGCGMDVQILNMKAGAKAHLFHKHESPVTAMALAPDGRSALTGDVGGDLLWWDLAAGAITHRVRAHVGAVLALAIAPEGTHAVSGGADGATRLWDLSCGCHTFPIANPSSQAEVSAVAFSTDGRAFLAGDAEGRTNLWATDTGNYLHGLRAADDPIASVRCFDSVITAVTAPIPSEVASHSRVFRWDAQTGRPLPCFDKPVEPRIIPGCVGLDRDGRRLLVAGRSPALPFQHVPTVLAGTLAEVRDGFRDFFRMRHGRAGSSSLEVWSLSSGACLHAFPAVAGDIRCLAVSPDNTRILASSTDGNLHVFAMPEA
jgi:WD domain, G-beta repeat